MEDGAMLRLLFVLASAVTATAQEPMKLRFQFVANQAYTYRVVQTTTVSEVALDENTRKPVAVDTSTKLTITKVWKVKETRPDGSAILEMTTTALKQETTQTVGTGKPATNTLDSSVPADAKAMAFLNKPILTLTMGPQGDVSGVKSELPGAADRLTADLPFKVVLPAAAIPVEATWKRPFEYKLPPPLGTGETFGIEQNFSFLGEKDGVAVVNTVTALKKPLTEKGLLPGVAPILWRGDVFIDTKAGTYRGAKLTVSQSVENHQGEGTKFSYLSEYAEALE
jgi:hypothetical protein